MVKIVEAHSHALSGIRNKFNKKHKGLRAVAYKSDGRYTLKIYERNPRVLFGLVSGDLTIAKCNFSWRALSNKCIFADVLNYEYINEIKGFYSMFEKAWNKEFRLKVGSFTKNRPPNLFKRR